MQLTALQLYLSCMSLAAYSVLAIVMLWRASYKRWPFLLAMATLKILVILTLFFCSDVRHYRIYFYTYWIAALVLAFIGLGILFDAIRAIPGIRYTPASIAIGFTTASTVMAVGSAWLASHGGAKTFHITVMVLTMDRCIAVVWGTFAVSLFWAIAFCGFSWTPTPLRVATGFLAMTAISGVDAYAMSLWPQLAFRIDNAADLVNLGTLSYFSLTMYCEKNIEHAGTSERVLELTRSLLPKQDTKAHRER